MISSYTFPSFLVFFFQIRLFFHLRRFTFRGRIEIDSCPNLKKALGRSRGAPLGRESGWQGVPGRRMGRAGFRESRDDSVVVRHRASDWQLARLSTGGPPEPVAAPWARAADGPRL